MAYRTKGGVMRCELHGPVPMGAGFRCPQCEAAAPRDANLSVVCWRCGADRWIRRHRVMRCRACDDAGYPYDTP